MFNLKNSMFLFLLIAGCAFGQKKKIETFTDLFTNLTAGEIVTTVIEYGKATLVSDSGATKSINAIGGMKLLPFEYFPRMSVRNEKAFVSCSESILISHPRYGFVINFIKMRLYDDGSVEIIAKYLDPLTYAVKMDETFKTQINFNGNDGAVFLYK